MKQFLPAPAAIAAIVLAAPAVAKPAKHSAKVSSNPSVPQSADIAKLNRKSLSSIPATPAAGASKPGTAKP